MYEQVEKSKENKSRAIANQVSQRQSSRGLNFQFNDKRPQAIVQRQLNEMANGSKQNNGALNVPVAQRLQINHFAKGSTVESVVQRVLYEDFLEGKVNNAIAGERHGELKEDSEEEEWNKINVKLYFEADSIPVDSEKEAKQVTPDKLSLRLGFLIERGRETYLTFWKDFGEGKEINLEGDLSMKMQSYWATVFENDLERLVDPSEKETKKIFSPKNIELMIKSLKEYQKYLPKSDKACLNYKANRETLAKYLMFQIKNIGVGFNDNSKPLASADEWRRYRSTSMALGIEEVTKGGGQLIYKVGNSHIGDIKDDIKEGIIKANPKTQILTKDEYISEYIELISAISEVENEERKKEGKSK